MASYSNEFYNKTQPNFNKFVQELTNLSRKYGVAVYGHFDLTDDPEEFNALTYTNDISSSDIRAENYWED